MLLFAMGSLSWGPKAKGTIKATVRGSFILQEKMLTQSPSFFVFLNSFFLKIRNRMTDYLLKKYSFLYSLLAKVLISSQESILLAI